MSSLRLLAYAMGGGHGHLTRQLRILETLESFIDVRKRVLCPARSLHFLDKFETQPRLGRAPALIDRESLGKWVVNEMEEFQPDLILVDTFPRGVLGEIVFPDGVKRLLVTRWVQPNYYLSSGVRRALEGYDEVFWTEPPCVPDFCGTMVEPVTDQRPLLAREEARALLGADHRPLVLALGSGALNVQQADRHNFLQKCTEQNWDGRWLSWELKSAVKDIGLHFRGADLLLSAAGYNSYYEILRAGTPAVLSPQVRKIDDQFRRASGEFPYSLSGPHIVAGRLSCLQAAFSLLGKESVPGPALRGAQQIAERIVQLMRRDLSEKTSPCIDRTVKL